MKCYASTCVFALLATVAEAQSATPATFPTPEAASAALVKAVQAGQSDRVIAILGPEMKDALKSESPDLDKLERDLFLLAARRAVKVERDADNKSRAIVYFGEQEWPFPAPLVKEGQSWRFDGSEGLQELQDRRLGRNELGAMAVCNAYVAAQLEYGSEDWDDDGILEFAQRASSSPAKHDGLYWSNDQGQSLSPLGPLFAQAARSGDNPQPPSGYHFKILTRQSQAARGGDRDYVVDGNMVLGFALVAWPAEYGRSGISTFIVNQLGAIYEKDLGEKTASVAKKMEEFNPDSTWKRVPQD